MSESWRTHASYICEQPSYRLLVAQNGDVWDWMIKHNRLPKARYGSADTAFAAQKQAYEAYLDQLQADCDELAENKVKHAVRR